MKKVLAIYDVEASYGERLTSYISKKDAVPFEMVLFTEEKALIQFALIKRIDVLLINQEVMTPEIEALSVDQVIYLTDLEEQMRTESLSRRSIYKYQPTDYVVREIMACYEAIVQAPLSGTAAAIQSEIIGIYSPVARCRKTAFALTLGEIMAQEEEVLYLNFEGISGFEELFAREYTYDLSDAFYYFDRNTLRLHLPVLTEQLKHLRIIPPVRYPEDIRGITGDTAARFVGELAGCGQYQCLILDLSEQIFSAEALLPLCSKIYMPIREDICSRAKLARFEKICQMKGQESVLERIQKLTLPSGRMMVNPQLYIEQLLWGDMGDYVRTLLGRAGNSDRRL